ncbi:MAG: FAD-binding protein [Acidobacteria bacterium]|nr:FAD-binding protein [Acidobacteriota bacterium]
MKNPIVEELLAILRKDQVLHEPDELLVYESDGLTLHRSRPLAVVLPESTEDVAALLRLLARLGVPFVARGAGTGLSGGGVAESDAVIIGLARMNRILRIDYENRLAIVEPGLINLHLTRAVEPRGYYYAPDPSSQMSCTIGGNVAENSGGPHCLKHGMTTNHILALEVVLPDGQVVELGGGGAEAPGYNLVGLFVGSEGMFGIATKITVRLKRAPQAVKTMLVDFLRVEDASRAVSAIIAARILPAALEMMDRATVKAVEASVLAAGLPTDAAAVLIIELDGVSAGLAEDEGSVIEICKREGARQVRVARNAEERIRLWAGRKGAFGAMGRISPDLMVQDAVIPRSKLPEVLPAVYRIAERCRLRVSNVFHAGDGNLHPNINFDSRDVDEVRRVNLACKEIMELCVQAGGSITGEHGVGLDKKEYMHLIFSDEDLSAMAALRSCFDPQGLANPGKVLPMHRCRAF